MEAPFLHKLGQKIVILRGFQQEFFRTAGFLLKFSILIEFPNILHWKPEKKTPSGLVLGQKLGQIMSNIVKKVKKQAISLGFFCILFREYLLKQKVVVVKPPEWKVFGNYS